MSGANGLMFAYIPVRLGAEGFDAQREELR